MKKRVFGNIKPTNPLESKHKPHPHSPTKQELSSKLVDIYKTQSVQEFCKYFATHDIVDIRAIRYKIDDLYDKHCISQRIYRMCQNIIMDLYFKRDTLHSSPRNQYQEEQYAPLNDYKALRYRKPNNKKILLIDKNEIVWVHKAYGLADNTKKMWRTNTRKNRKKMEIINSYIMKQ